MTYATTKIPKPLADEIDKLVKANIKGYRTRMEFVVDAVREKLNNFDNELKEPRFIHVNVYVDHATIWDNLQRKLVDVSFKEDCAWCEKDGSKKCDHVEFALSLQKVKEAYHKKGLKIPEL
jgi:Arc/MetJ-type ribon-helix-helix transcriptional regulator